MWADLIDNYVRGTPPTATATPVAPPQESCVANGSIGFSKSERPVALGAIGVAVGWEKYPYSGSEFDPPLTNSLGSVHASFLSLARYLLLCRLKSLQDILANYPAKD